MADELVIVPSSGDGYVELARTKQGRLFRKHLLNKGKLTHPEVGEINIDDKFVKSLKANFDAGVCPIVQVPLADANNKHSEAPDRNIGEVIGIEEKDDKIYAVLDVRDPVHAERIGKTYLGASAMLALDYTDTKTQQKVGPTLLHSCVTNRPYVTDLDDYQEIIAATADNNGGAVMLTTETVVVPRPTEETTDMGDAPKAPEITPAPAVTPAKPTLEELLTTLKNDHQIDVTGLQAKAAEATQAAALSQALTEALGKAGIISLSNTDNDAKVSTEDVVGAVAELANNNVTLSTRVQALERADADHAVQTLVDEGRVMPAMKDAMVELKLTNTDMFNKLVPAEAIVKLGNENGVNPPKADGHVQDVDAEIARLSALISK